MKKVKITISLDPEVNELLFDLSKKLGTKKSTLINDLLVSVAPLLEVDNTKKSMVDYVLSERIKLDTELGELNGLQKDVSIGKLWEDVK